MTDGQVEAMRTTMECVADMDGRTVLALRTNKQYMRGAEDALSRVAEIAQRALEVVGGE